MRLLTRLVIALLICLVAIPTLIPATPVLAAEKIMLDPDEGRVGDRIEIEGEDFSPSFPPDYYSEVDIYFSSDVADENDDIDDEVTAYEKVKTGYNVDEYGEFSTYFYVPDELTDGDDEEVVYAGTYYAYVTYRGDDNIEAVADFTVVVVRIALEPASGHVHDQVVIQGWNFADRKDITIEYDNQEVYITSGDTKTGSNGSFYCTIIIPESTADIIHAITVTDRSGYTDDADFSVRPKIGVSPVEGFVGDSLSVSGSGFAAGKSVTITWDGVQKGTATTDTKGSFLAVSFAVPVSIHGSHSIVATDALGNTATANFVIESIPPPLPELLSPADGSRVGWIGDVVPTFEWSTVTDPSEPVAYTLQIATTENFTDPDMRQIPGITAGDEEIVTYAAEEPLSYGTYYWRVKAIDSAQNDSGWTTPYSLHAGLLPLWAFIAIIALIVVIIAVLVYVFAIRRRPYA